MDSFKVGIVALILTCSGFVSSPSVSQADVIELDISSLGAFPEIADACVQAAAIWEARIQAYSTEVPPSIRMQLTSLKISCEAVAVGNANLLGFAGPDAVLTQQTFTPFGTINKSVALEGTLTINLDNLALFQLQPDLLVSTAAHEIAHVFGFGTLWTQNDLVGPVSGFGTVQYFGGTHAVAKFREESGNPVLPFIPLEQAGGGGSALAHWDDTGIFVANNRQDIMLAVAPPPGVEETITETTFAAMADLGFAVDGVNGQLAAQPGLGAGKWPKIYGPAVNPFGGNGLPVNPDGNLKFHRVKIRAVTLKPGAKPNSGPVVLGETGKPGTGSRIRRSVDPYNLRSGAKSKN
jgi:hypothetical protein